VVTWYYSLDLLVGYGLPVVVTVLAQQQRLSRQTWRLFWWGVLLGLVWEVPIFVLSAESWGPAIIHWIHPLPTHYGVFLIAHSLWDGGLFLAGLALMKRLGARPCCQRFSAAELTVLVLWGQLSALLVELSSTYSEAWAYREGHWWNVTLFHFNNHPITLLPQGIWLVAPLAFYGLALREHRGQLRTAGGRRVGLS
jgi:hypothetical protein